MVFDAPAGQDAVIARKRYDVPMRAAPLRFALLSLFLVAVLGQSPKEPAFDTASVKISPHLAGPDSNNTFSFGPAGITGRNVTLRRLVAEAYGLQLSQVVGPAWLDQNEYEIDAKTDRPVPKEQLARMLRTLLTERFKLAFHSDTRNLRVYELVVDKTGLRIHAVEEDNSDLTTGSPLRTGMKRFADFLTVQLTIPVSMDPTQPSRAGGPAIPVIDKTGLTGLYDLPAGIRPEPDSNTFSLWQKVLQDKMGLRLEPRKSDLKILVIDAAEKLPTAN
jgi:uncharacterized protein (TIGR03435 family)